MKQIKTIVCKMENNKIFDNDVNIALAEGWTLVKRDVIQPYEGETQIFYRALYAELERETVETKRCCEACGMEKCTDAPCVKEALKE